MLDRPTNFSYQHLRLLRSLPARALHAEDRIGGGFKLLGKPAVCNGVIEEENDAGAIGAPKCVGMHTGLIAPMMARLSSLHRQAFDVEVFHESGIGSGSEHPSADRLAILGDESAVRHRHFLGACHVD